MLQITQSAAGVIKQVRAGNKVPESAALRIQTVEASPGGEEGIGFSFTSGPKAGDQAISEEPDLRVYLAPELVTPLDTAVLDTIETPGGTELQLRVEGPEGHGNQNHDHADHEGHDHP